jgi:hypothetical protein
LTGALTSHCVARGGPARSGMESGKAMCDQSWLFTSSEKIGYKIIENFMLISKMQTCISDKMPPKKVKIKKGQKMT